MDNYTGALKVFRLVAKEFDSIEEEEIISNMELYSDQISRRRFGKSYDKALAYLTAHKLKMLGNGEDSGLGTVADQLRVSGYSEKEASVSFNFVDFKNPDAEFMLTVYGVEYLSLKRRAVIPIMNAGEYHG